MWKAERLRKSCHALYFAAQESQLFLTAKGENCFQACELVKDLGVDNSCWLYIYNCSTSCYMQLQNFYSTPDSQLVFSPLSVPLSLHYNQNYLNSSAATINVCLLETWKMLVDFRSCRSSYKHSVLKTQEHWQSLEKAWFPIATSPGNSQKARCWLKDYHTSTGGRLLIRVSLAHWSLKYRLQVSGLTGCISCSPWHRLLH